MSTNDNEKARAEELDLSPDQERAIEARLAGKNWTEVADEAGVNRTTVWRWRTKDADFQAALNRARAERQEYAESRIWELTDKIVETLEGALEDGDAQVALRLASKMGLLTGERPKVGHTDPTRIRTMDALRDVFTHDLDRMLYLWALLAQTGNAIDDKTIKAELNRVLENGATDEPHGEWAADLLDEVDGGEALREFRDRLDELKGSGPAGQAER